MKKFIKRHSIRIVWILVVVIPAVVWYAAIRFMTALSWAHRLGWIGVAVAAACVFIAILLFFSELSGKE